jgi:hypothetical protein
VSDRPHGRVKILPFLPGKVKKNQAKSGVLKPERTLKKNPVRTESQDKKS